MSGGTAASFSSAVIVTGSCNLILLRRPPASATEPDPAAERCRSQKPHPTQSHHVVVAAVVVGLLKEVMSKIGGGASYC